MKPWIPVSILALWGVHSGIAVSDVRDEVKPKGKVLGLDAHETHAAASLLGQFRTSVSGWLWVRTDLYLHNGVQMRPLSEVELQAGRKGVGSSDNQDGSLHNDDYIVTVIPTAERDFRGVFGDIDRATKAYKDMTNHDHNDPRQALPLFRLMTWIDPYFINGWVVGSAILTRDKTPEAYSKAIDFLEQGLEKNPGNVSILNQKGTVYLSKLLDFRRAIPTFQQAVRNGTNLGLAKLDEEDRESLLWAYRWLVLAYRDTGRLDQMYATADAGMKLFPEDPILPRIRNTPPYVLRDRGEKGSEAKLEAPDPAEH